MKILWMTWKDLKNPQAGGAEVVNEEMAGRLVRDGHEVVLLTAGYRGAEPQSDSNGYRVVRRGNRYTVYWEAFRYYREHLREWPDLVIDEMNTIPFFCKYYVGCRNVLLAYQLCRRIWFYQMPFPMSLVGYLLEPLYLRMLSDRDVLTESQSTRRDMARFGFDEARIRVFPIGISIPPLASLAGAAKVAAPTLLSLGALRAMKRTLDQIEAFEIAKKSFPKLKLKVAGGAADAYGKRVLDRISRSAHAADIEYLGQVDEAQKLALMRSCHLILVSSVKEGWGLIVTEANSQGTPAAVYDVDGLRDSVRHGETGWICRSNTPAGLAHAINEALTDAEAYARVREAAWRWSRTFEFEAGYRIFRDAAGIA